MGPFHAEAALGPPFDKINSRYKTELAHYMGRRKWRVSDRAEYNAGMPPRQLLFCHGRRSSWPLAHVSSGYRAEAVAEFEKLTELAKGATPQPLIKVPGRRSELAP